MENTIRKLVVSCLAVMSMAGGTVAYGNGTRNFCHAETFASLPESLVFSLFNLNKTGLPNHLGAAKIMFTSSGYQGYLAALRQSGTLADVQNGVKMTAKADGPRQMTGPCDAPTVRVPSRFTYVDGKKAYHLPCTVVLRFVANADSAIPMPKIAQMVVVPPLKSPQGAE